MRKRESSQGLSMIVQKREKSPKEKVVCLRNRHYEKKANGIGTKHLCDLGIQEQEEVKYHQNIRFNNRRNRENQKIL